MDPRACLPMFGGMYLLPTLAGPVWVLWLEGLSPLLILAGLYTSRILYRPTAHSGSFLKVTKA